MKKQILAFAVGLAFCAANAYADGELSNGFVVPNVIHNGAGDTTAVGLVNTTGDTVRIFWTFFDQDGQRVDKGCFVMNDKRYRPFVWSNEASPGQEGKRGYLVFAAAGKYVALPSICGIATPSMPITATLRSADTTKVNGNAFQVNLASQDVAFIPVISGKLIMKTPDANIAAMDSGALKDVWGAPFGKVKQNLRYYIDGATGGDDTHLLMWSTADIRGTHMVTAYDSNSNGVNVAMTLPNGRQNWINAENIPGLPATHRDGFIEWNPAITPTNYSAMGGAAGQSIGDLKNDHAVFTFSVISSPAFGAVQTLLGFYGN